MEHFPQASWWSSRCWPGQLKGPQNEHEESGRISGIWKQLSTFTNWQIQEQFVVATTLRPRRYRARYLECAIQGPTARQDADEAERARWIQVLADMLKATHTSMSQLLSTSTKLLRGGRTVSTLRSGVRVLRRFLSLLALNHQQVYPLSWLQLTEYLRVNHEEPCSSAGLKNTYQANSFLKEMAGVPSKQRFTNSQLYHVFHQELLASALPGRPSKQAPRSLVPVLAALNPLVVDHDTPQYFRMFAWWLLLQACHAQGQRPLRHQASRRAASRPHARSQADTVQDNRGRPKPDVQKACCGCVLFCPEPKNRLGAVDEHGEHPERLLAPSPGHTLPRLSQEGAGV